MLSVFERRILGVLVEKQKTTPDAYPMSVNGLVTGSNQKSNRDPVMNLTDEGVEDTLASAQKKGLVIRLQGTGRVEKWRHNLYDAWGVNKVEMAVLAELMLRGPQTEGELRGRVSRMEPVEDLDALRALLRPLAERKLIVYLTPEGRRGTTLTHGFHDARELDRARAAVPAESPAPAPVMTPPVAAPRPVESALEAKLAEATGQIAELRGRVAELSGEVARLGEQVRKIQEGLGL